MSPRINFEPCKNGCPALHLGERIAEIACALADQAVTASKEADALIAAGNGSEATRLLGEAAGLMMASRVVLNLGTEARGLLFGDRS